MSVVAELFDANFGFALRSLRHLGVSETLLEDAVQDVFVIAHRRWSTFEQRSSPRTWIFGIARRVAWKYRRRAATRRQRFAPATAAGEAVHDPYERVVAAHSLAAMLATLDEHKRAVFVLHELEGMTAPEVAEALGIPLGTAYSRLRAAWKVLGEEANRQTELERLRKHEPQPQRQRRIWALVAAKIGQTGAAPIAVVPWLANLKAAGIGALASTALLAVGVAVSPEPQDAEPVSAAALPEPPPPEPEPPLPDPEPPPAVHRPPLPTAAPPVAAAVAVPASSAGATSTPSRATRRTPAPSPAPDPFTAEVDLLEQAQNAIANRRPNDALRLLDQHRRRFPSGQLQRERAKARVAALCLAGRAREASDTARSLGQTDDPCE